MAKKPQRHVSPLMTRVACSFTTCSGTCFGFRTPNRGSFNSEHWFSAPGAA